jgi:hypothetical protein
MNNYEKVEGYFKILYPNFNSLSVDEKIKAIEDKKIICEYYNQIDKKNCEAIKSENEYYDERKTLQQIIRLIKTEICCKILYPNYEELQQNEKIKAIKVKEILNKHIDEIELPSEDEEKIYSSKQILEETIKNIQVNEYFNEIYPDFNNLSAEEKIKAMSDRKIILENFEKVEASVDAFFINNGKKESYKEIVLEAIKSVKVQQLFDKLYPNYKALSAAERCKAIKNKKIIMNNIGKIESDFEINTSLNSAAKQNGISDEKILEEIIKSIKAEELYKIIYSNVENLNQEEKLNAVNDKILIKKYIDEIEEKLDEENQSYLMTQKEDCSEKKILEKIIKEFRVKELYEKIYPNFEKLSIKEKIQAYSDKKIIIDHLEKIEKQFKDTMNIQDEFSEKKVMKDIIKSIKVDEFFNKMYPKYNGLSADEKKYANNNKIMLKQYIDQVELKYNSYCNNEQGNIDDKAVIGQILSSLKVNEYLEKIYQNYNGLSIEEKIKYNNYKEIISNNLREIEKEFEIAMKTDSVAEQKGYSEKKILQEIVKAFQVEKYFKMAYPKFNEMSVDQKNIAINDKTIIANYLNQVEDKYIMYIKLHSNNEETIDNQEAMANILKAVKVQCVFEKLYPNFMTGSKKEKIMASNDRAIIINNIDEIEKELVEFSKNEQISSRNEIINKELKENIFKKIKVQEYFKILYPNFNTLSAEKRSEAIENKKVIFDNLNIIEEKISLQEWSETDKEVIEKLLNTLKNKKKEDGLNFSKKIEKVKLDNILQNETEENNSDNMQLDHVEINVGWKQKLINKLNVIKRLLKKQKALPKASDESCNEK